MLMRLMYLNVIALRRVLWCYKIPIPGYTRIKIANFHMNYENTTQMRVFDKNLGNIETIATIGNAITRY